MKIKRDKYGDAISPEVPSDIEKELKDRNSTYAWKVKINDIYCEVDHNLQKWNDKLSFLPEYELEKIELFRPDNILYYLNKYFKEALNRSITFSFNDLRIDYFYVVLTKNKKDEIDQFIKDYQLIHYKDLLIYLIVKIQDIYIRDIRYYEENEEAHSSLITEIDKLIFILKSSDNSNKEIIKNH